MVVALYFNSNHSGLSDWVSRALDLGNECTLPSSAVGADIVNALRAAWEAPETWEKIALGLGTSQPTTSADVEQYLSYIHKKRRRVIGLQMIPGWRYARRTIPRELTCVRSIANFISEHRLALEARLGLGQQHRNNKYRGGEHLSPVSAARAEAAVDVDAAREAAREARQERKRLKWNLERAKQSTAMLSLATTM